MKIVTGIIALVAAGTLAGCSSSSDGPAVAVPTMPTAANPVTILAKMHVPTTATEGQIDIYGNRYASGQFADGEKVTVCTYATEAAKAAGIARNSGPSDISKLLVGDLFTVVVTGVDTGNGIVFPESPATLAQQTAAQVRS